MARGPCTLRNGDHGRIKRRMQVPRASLQVDGWQTQTEACAALRAVASRVAQVASKKVVNGRRPRVNQHGDSNDD